MEPTAFPLAQAADMRQTIDALARTPQSQIVMIVVALTVLRFAIAPVLKKTPAHKRSGVFVLLRIFNEFLDALVYAGIFVFLIIRPFIVQAFVIPSGSMWPALYVNDFIVANKAIYRFSEPKAGDIVVFRPPVAAVSPRDVGPDGQVKIDYIKRLIGRPGDLIEIKEGQLYRNGEAVPEPYKGYTECTQQLSNGDCLMFRSLDEKEVASLTKANFKLVEYNGKIIPFNWTAEDGNSSSPKPTNWSQGAPYAIAPQYVIDDPVDAEKLKSAPAVKIPPDHFLMMGDNRNGSFDGRAW
ncbi:signal peptidase I, partial [bacterium]